MSLVSFVKSSSRFLARVIFVFPILPFLYLFEPFRKIRLGLMYTQRIGHLAGNSELILRRWQLDGHDPKQILILVGIDPANRQLFEMQKRILPICESQFMTWLFFAWRPLMRRTRFFFPLNWTDRDYRELNLASPGLSFTAEEQAKGQSFLLEMGLPHDAWFVCMHARDPAYLDAHRPQYKHLWRSRDFRNCSIENFMLAAEYITRQGGYVLRMGATVDRPLPDNNNPMIIDYATHHRSDFMDIFLPANCRFFLGNSSGLFVVSTIFARPIALANNFAVASIPFRKEDIFITKFLRETASGRILSFSEGLEKGFYSLDTPNIKEGYELVENTPEEILALSQEIIDRLAGKPIDDEAATLQKLYKERFMSQYTSYELAGEISGSFIKSFPFLIAQ